MFDIDLATRSAGIEVKFGLGRHLYADVSGDGGKMPIVIGKGLDVEIANVGCAFETASGAANLDSSWSFFNGGLGRPILHQGNVARSGLGPYLGSAAAGNVSLSGDGFNHSESYIGGVDIANARGQFCRAGNADEFLVAGAGDGRIDLRLKGDIDPVRNAGSRAG